MNRLDAELKKEKHLISLGGLFIFFISIATLGMMIFIKGYNPGKYLVFWILVSIMTMVVVIYRLILKPTHRAYYYYKMIGLCMLPLALLLLHSSFIFIVQAVTHHAYFLILLYLLVFSLFIILTFLYYRNRTQKIVSINSTFTLVNKIDNEYIFDINKSKNIWQIEKQLNSKGIGDTLSRLSPLAPFLGMMLSRYLPYPYDSLAFSMVLLLFSGFVSVMIVFNLAVSNLLMLWEEKLGAEIAIF